eukprot:gb/GFBE01074969.1/.p1 GENE.gb/GFBE01074969.1/~~gb/GFBE01074969.1/.p1  ORF type:complete len:249 (+),score=37.58 gb/GFBE01074969.1/:1-747(+)
MLKNRCPSCLLLALPVSLAVWLLTYDYVGLAVDGSLMSADGRLPPALEHVPEQGATPAAEPDGQQAALLSEASPPLPAEPDWQPVTIDRKRIRLIIHIGPGKTGTTSFQSFLSLEQRWLRREHNLLVSAKGAEDIHLVAARILEDSNLHDFLERRQQRTDDIVMSRLKFQLQGALRRGDRTVIISSEVFLPATPDQWRRLLGELSDGIDPKKKRVDTQSLPGSMGQVPFRMDAFPERSPGPSEFQRQH